MISRKYKSAFGVLVQPLNLALHRLRISADHLTLAGIVFGALAALAFAEGRLPLGGLFLALAGVADMLDGSLARASGSASRFGSFIDSVADRATDVLILGGLAWHFRATTELAVTLAAIGGSFLVSYAKARAEGLGIACDVGLMERPERMILLIAGALSGLMRTAVWLLAVLSLVTAIQRVWHVRRELNGRG
ncbi:MAG TPA: CDP-alcohol phosphatidyltransferase family protein [Candidatus Methanoperedens sp.]|nr:CDP-alcohol phosphatidyltransferase family protein [Candidatus Methanoperedens sp.]